MEEGHAHRSARARLKRNFLTGILVLIPIMGTLFLFTWVFAKITDNGLEYLKEWEYFEALFLEHETSYGIVGRLTVLFVLFGVITIVGFLTRNFIGHRLVRLTEKFLENIPLINRVFIGLKQISQAIISSDSSLFSYAVLFEYPRPGIYAIGFVMSEARGEIQERTTEDVLSIFLPTTPNPTSGFFIMVPKKDTIRLSMSVEDALKMIISGGAVVPEFNRNEFIEKYASGTDRTGQPAGEEPGPEEEVPGEDR